MIFYPFSLYSALITCCRILSSSLGSTMGKEAPKRPDIRAFTNRVLSLFNLHTHVICVVQLRIPSGRSLYIPATELELHDVMQSKSSRHLRATYTPVTCPVQLAMLKRGCRSIERRCVRNLIDCQRCRLEP